MSTFTIVFLIGLVILFVLSLITEMKQDQKNFDIFNVLILFLVSGFFFLILLHGLRWLVHVNWVYFFRVAFT